MKQYGSCSLCKPKLAMHINSLEKICTNYRLRSSSKDVDFIDDNGIAYEQFRSAQTGKKSIML